MKRDTYVGKQIIANVLAILMIFSSLITGAFPIGVHAQSENPVAVLGQSIVQGDVLHIRGKVERSGKSTDWSEEYIVLNPTQTNTGTDGALLITKNYSDKTIVFKDDTEYDVNEYPAIANIWEGSDAQKCCTRYFASLPGPMRSMLVGVKTNETESGYHWAEINNIDGTNGTKDKVFFLSVNEYNTYKQAVRCDNKHKMMLRTPGSDCTPDLKVYISVIDENGNIKNFGTTHEMHYRPAFNIGLPKEICAPMTKEDGFNIWDIDINDMEHSLGSPSYTWSADNNECTAKVTCNKCGGTIKEVTKTTAKITKEATALKEGEIQYTAAFSNSIFSTQTKTEVNEHSYSNPVYTWGADNSTCTANVRCSICGKELSETVRTSSKVIKEAAVNETGEILYTASFAGMFFSQQSKTVTIPKTAEEKKLKIGDRLYIGRKNVKGFTGLPYWRVLDIDKDGNYLLMSEYLWTGSSTTDFLQFNGSDSKSPEWQGSNAQRWCRNFEAAVLSGIEGLSVLETTKTDEECVSDFPEIVFGRRSNILNKEKVFFLSADEVFRYMPNRESRLTYLHDGQNKGSLESYWLRSPRKHEQAECAGRVLVLGDDRGKVGRGYVYNAAPARPAFWAKLDGFTADSNVAPGTAVVKADDIAEEPKVSEDNKTKSSKTEEVKKENGKKDKNSGTVKGSKNSKDSGTSEEKAAESKVVGKGVSSAKAEKTIVTAKNDRDISGSVYRMLQLKSEKQAKNSITLKWKKVRGAKKYVVYGNACGKKNKMKKLKTLKKNSFNVKKIGKKKLKKGTYHKFIVVALDKNDKVVSTSKIIHVATKGGKSGNNKAVATKAAKNKVTLKKGKTFKLAGKAIPASKKLKVKKHRTVSYESSNAKVASVSRKGVIKGIRKGKCRVYAYSQEGICKVVNVTIK